MMPTWVWDKLEPHSTGFRFNIFLELHRESLCVFVGNCYYVKKSDEKSEGLMLSVQQKSTLP